MAGKEYRRSSFPIGSVLSKSVALVSAICTCLVSIDWSNTKYGNPFCVAAQDGKMWHSTEGGVEEKAKKVRWACFEASPPAKSSGKYTSGTAPKTRSAEIRRCGSYGILEQCKRRPHSGRLPPALGCGRPMLQKPPVKEARAHGTHRLRRRHKPESRPWAALCRVPEMNAVDGFPARDMGMPAQDHIAGAHAGNGGATGKVVSVLCHDAQPVSARCGAVFHREGKQHEDPAAASQLPRTAYDGRLEIREDGNHAWRPVAGRKGVARAVIQIIAQEDQHIGQQLLAAPAQKRGGFRGTVQIGSDEQTHGISFSRNKDG